MSDVLADTHVLVWSLFDPGRMSPAALSALTAASLSRRIFISAITLVEVNYLSGKKTFPYSGVLQLPGGIAMAVTIPPADPAHGTDGPVSPELLIGASRARQLVNV